MYRWKSLLVVLVVLVLIPIVVSDVGIFVVHAQVHAQKEPALKPTLPPRVLHCEGTLVAGVAGSGVNENGTLLSVHFRGVTAGTGGLQLMEMKVADVTANPIGHTTQDGNNQIAYQVYLPLAIKR